MTNRYEDWTGVGVVTDSKIFKAIGEVADEQEVEDIRDYLPAADSATTSNFFVARIATKSRKIEGKDVVKLFGNSSWSKEILSELEGMEFESVDDNRDRLVSDLEIELIAGDWKATGHVEIFRDLDPPGKPTAKIAFTRSKDDKSVSAFWCWPE